MWLHIEYKQELGSKYSYGNIFTLDNTIFYHEQMNCRNTQ